MNNINFDVGNRNGENNSNFRHGFNLSGKRHRIYNCWADMKKRCLNPNSKSYKYYGGRGITIPKRWMDFQGFLDDMWDLYDQTAKELGTEATLSLERVNVNGNYSKRNCIWIPKNEQGKNTRRVHRITWKGKTQSARDWSKELNISEDVVYMRIHRGWNYAKALTHPIKKITSH